MNTSMLKVTLLAAAAALSVPAPAAEVQDASRDAGIGPVIAAQGNSALRTIRDEFRFSVYLVKPALPPRQRTAAQVVEALQRPKGTRIRA